MTNKITNRLRIRVKRIAGAELSWQVRRDAVMRSHELRFRSFVLAIYPIGGFMSTVTNTVEAGISWPISRGVQQQMEGQ